MEEQINKDFNIEKLSHWAHEKYVVNGRWLDSETYYAVMRIISMIEGEEFEFTKEELLEFAKALQK